MRAFFQKCRKRLRSRAGQTFVLVMTVTAMGTVLGFMAMSAALMSMRVRAANRLADKTFYRLEMAEEEIRAGLSRDMMEVAAGASQGRDWRVMLLDSRMGIHDVNVLLPENAAKMASRREAAGKSAGEYLAELSATIPVAGHARTVQDRTEEITVTVGDIELGTAGELLLKDVEMTLINYERDSQAQIICDLTLRIPDQGRIPLNEVVRVGNWRRIG